MAHDLIKPPAAKNRANLDDALREVRLRRERNGSGLGECLDFRPGAA
jgi:hypothetical protein